MSVPFLILTVVFIVVSAVMVLIVLVQRPQGGGLAGAFGGAGGGSTDTVFGGRVGDALTVMTVIAFVVYLGLAIGLNVVPVKPATTAAPAVGPSVTTADGTTVPLEPVEGPPPGAQFPPAATGQPQSPPPAAPSGTQPPAGDQPQPEPAPTEPDASLSGNDTSGGETPEN